MPKKMRRLAIKCMLSAKVADGELKVIDKIEMSEPKTKKIKGILDALAIDRSALIALSSTDSNIAMSANNIKGINAIEARQLNVVDLLSHKNLIMTSEAVRTVEELWGKSQVAVEG